MKEIQPARHGCDASGRRRPNGKPHQKPFLAIPTREKFAHTRISSFVLVPCAQLSSVFSLTGYLEMQERKERKGRESVCSGFGDACARLRLDDRFSPPQ